MKLIAENNVNVPPPTKNKALIEAVKYCQDSGYSLYDTRQYVKDKFKGSISYGTIHKILDELNKK